MPLEYQYVYRNFGEFGLYEELVVVEDYSNPVIGMDHQDVIASDNKTGFETGQVVVQDGIHYMFIGEMLKFRRIS